MLLAFLLAIAAPAVPAAEAEPPVVTTPSGLRFQTLKPGTGRRPLAGDAVLVTYEGRLADGTVFDASKDPIGFGVSDVVSGFAEALLLMSKGGTYRIWLPPHLAYGETGGGTIPPGATLDFTVTLHDIGRPVRLEPAPAQ